MRIKLLITTLLLVFVSTTQAQYFGGFPAYIKWLQIESPHVRVIFPEGLSYQANRVASDIEFLISEQDSVLDFKLRKIDIVLNNQMVESNGYVASMPYHSMFFLTQSQNANIYGAQDWLDGLTIHEYRHVWQYNQMRSGLCKLMYVLMGDKGWGGYIHMIFPDWYFEGDAVLSETQFTNSGRGRLPYFSLTERAMALDSVRYKYIKVRNGSYKDELPNRYQFGYNLLAYGHKKFGEEGWRRIVKGASRLNGVFYPFSHALRKEAGSGAWAFYDSMQVDYRNHTLANMAERKVTPSTKITQPIKTVSNYYQSVFETDSTLLVMRSSYKEMLSLYSLNIHTGKEKKLYDIGYIDNPWFSYANGMVVWSEFRNDERRWNKGYSIIKKLSLKTIVARDLTQKTNYFSPAYSPNGRKIAVIEYTPNQKCNIKIIDPITGNAVDIVEHSPPFDEDAFVSSPTFSEDGASLFFILKKEDRHIICEYVFETKQLMPYLLATSLTSNTITNPISKGNKIYFSGSCNGQDDVFYLNKEDGFTYRVTTAQLGAYYPTISSDEKKLIFSNYTLKGFDLQQMELPEQAERMFKDSVKDNYYASEIYTTSSKDLSSRVTTNTYEVKKYNRVANMLNFHSWGPTADSEYNTGVELYSNNILNNTSVLAGMYYNYNNDFSYARATAYYGGFYPVLYGGFTKVFDTQYDLQLFESGGILPLDFSTAVYAKYLSIQFGYLDQQLLLDKTDSYNFNGVHLALNYHNLKYPAKQQVASTKGISIMFDWKKGLLNNMYDIPETTIKTDIYLPGFTKTHAIKLQANQKVQTPEADGYFIDEMEYARGYERPDSMYVSYGKLGFNYQLPLCYPEFGIHSIFYLKRIRLNLFADIGRATLAHYNGTISKQNYTSMGTELYFDIRWFNALEIPFLVRYSYCFDAINKKNSLEFKMYVITF